MSATVLGAGAMPAGVGPFGTALIEYTATQRDTVASSREPTGTNEQTMLNDGTGSFKPCSDAFQRAAYFLNVEFYGDSSVIGASFVSDREARVRACLDPLIGGKEPVLILESVDVVDSGGSRTEITVNVRDPKSGQLRTYKAP